MNPYREPGLIIAPKIVKKTPQEIINRAGKAIENFAMGCPSGLTMVWAWTYNLKTNIMFKSYDSPHSTAITLSSHNLKNPNDTTKWDGDPHEWSHWHTMKPCCQEHRNALKELSTLNWFWKLRANWQLRKKYVSIALINGDQELIKLLLRTKDGSTRYYTYYTDYDRFVKYRQKD